MEDRDEPLPDNIEALKAALVIERGRRIVAETDAAFAKARASDDQALIAHLKLQIEKLNRDRYGPRSERTARLLDQLELRLEELETAATEDELAAEMAATKTTRVAPFTRNHPRTDGLRLLWRRAAVQARRGHYRDAGGHPEVLEGDPARPREVQLPRLREDQPGASAVPRDRERLGRAQSSSNGAVREIWPASAAQPAGRALCQGGRAGQSVDPGRPGRWLHGSADALVQASRGLRAERRAIAW